MKKKIVQVLFVSLMMAALTLQATKVDAEECNIQEIEVEPISVYHEYLAELEDEEIVEVIEKPEQLYSNEEIELIALITMAEAEGEPELGKRLVVDTILNRVDSPNFPNTINEVIFQKNQFTCTTNGRLNRVSVNDDILELVCDELEERENEEVLYFTAGRFGAYGTPYTQVENHFFSK